MVFGSLSPAPLFLGRVEEMIVVDLLCGVSYLARAELFIDCAGLAINALRGQETDRLVQLDERHAIIARIKVGIVS